MIKEPLFITLPNSKKQTGFFLGLLLFFSILIFLPSDALSSALHKVIPAAAPAQINEIAGGTKVVLAMVALMVCWWITEPIPLAVTALLPIIILPTFHVTGFADGKTFQFVVKNVLINYAHPVIYLFFAGFLFAAAFRKWELDKKITLSILSVKNIADNPKLIILAMMSIAALISMWISNTATAAMLIPIGLGITATFSNNDKNEANFSKALLLGIAWGASIGGIGTIIGTPPNGICVSVLRNAGYADISFLQWMVIGIPIVILFLPLAWQILLTSFPFEPEKLSLNRFALSSSEKLSFTKEQKILLFIFLLTVISWITGSFAKDILPAAVYQKIEWIDENVIALIGAVMLFIIPVSLKKGEFLLSWEQAGSVEWGTLLLFGGGIALSDALFKSGSALMLASSISALGAQFTTLTLVLIIVFIMDFLTEITSNTAVTAMMLPVLLPVATAAGANPVIVAIAASIGASMAFMLPVATPPNALVYGTGKILIGDMIKAGFALDLMGWLVASFLVYFLAGSVFGF